MGINKLLLKFIWGSKKFGIANTILTKKNKVRELIVPNVKTYTKTTVIKTMWYWQKDR